MAREERGGKAQREKHKERSFTSSAQQPGAWSQGFFSIRLSNAEKNSFSSEFLWPRVEDHGNGFRLSSESALVLVEANMLELVLLAALSWCFVKKLVRIRSCSSFYDPEAFT